jgi:hypothetical protein
MIRSFAGIAIVATALGVVLMPGGRLSPVAAQPAAKPLTAELTYVPADAAIFIHVNAEALWNGPILKAVRGADPKLLEELTAAAKAMFGSTPDSLHSLTMFWPKFKQPSEMSSFGVVGVFKTPFDKDKLQAGLSKIAERDSKVKIVPVSDRIAVMLIGLNPETYGKPQTSREGPQTAAILEAGTGRHVASIGFTPAQFPDEIRGDNLPQEIRAFQPLLNAESLAGFVTLDKDLTVDIRVKASTPPRAKECEKCLGLLATLAGDTLGDGLKSLRKDAVNDVDARNLIAILAGFQSGVKDAKFTTEGETARVVAKTPADLPFASAFIAGKRKVQDAAARAQSSNNLKQIALAMHNYHDANNSMPPAAVCDKTGKPILSWRVLILPYIEEEALYKQFKLDEAWDSANNKKLIAKMPKVYALPGVPNVKADQTHYRLFVGNGAAHDYLKGPRIADFTDGTSNTILVATAKDSVIWSKPDELDFDPDKDMMKLLGRFHGDACIVAFGDGSVRALSPKLSKMSLHGLITRSGGDVVNEDE